MRSSSSLRSASSCFSESCFLALAILFPPPPVDRGSLPSRVEIVFVSSLYLALLISTLERSSLSCFILALIPASVLRLEVLVSMAVFICPSNDKSSVSLLVSVSTLTFLALIESISVWVSLAFLSSSSNDMET